MGAVGHTNEFSGALNLTSQKSQRREEIRENEAIDKARDRACVR